MLSQNIVPEDPVFWHDILLLSAW